MLLGFGVSHVFFNRGEIGVSTPLVYPVLLYLLARVLLAGFRPRRAAGPLVPHAPLTLLIVGLVFLTAFRVGLNVADSNVIDVGYAGVVGADRIVDGDQLYGEGFSTDVERGDTYGPVNYLLYVPFEQALPWSGRWDDLPAAHGAAISFDLLVIAGLLLLGPPPAAGAPTGAPSAWPSPTGGWRTPTQRSRSSRTRTTRSSRSAAWRHCLPRASRATTRRASGRGSRSALRRRRSS